MKKNLFILLMIGCMSNLFSQTQFWQDNFEGSPSSGTRTPEENGGVGGPPQTSYFKLTNGSDVSQAVAFTGKDATNYWAGEDHNAAGTGFTASSAQGAPTNSTLNELSITWTGINISGKTGLSFSGLLAANNTSGSWDNLNACLNGFASTNTDYLIVQYRIDGGTWVDLIRFFNKGSATGAANKSLFEDTDGNGCGDGTGLTNAFGEFTKTIPGTGTTLELRLNVSCEGDAEEWGVDNFRLFEAQACPTPTLSVVGNTNVLCNGGSTGSATVSATGGSPFTYTWSPSGGNAATATGLGAGNYTCVTTNSCGLTASNTVTISEPTAISLSAASQKSISCNGGSNGAASVSVSGGTSSFSYNWTPGNPTGDGTSSVTGLTAGNWTCTVTDANSCTTTQTFNITQPAALVASALSQTSVSCNGGSNGAASVSVSGGTSSFSYNWTPGNPTGDGTSSVTGLTAGNWTCTVTDANSCTTTQTFNIAQPAALVASALSQTSVSCKGGSNGAASVSVSGGTSSFSYNWTPGNPTGDGTSSVTGLTAGNWTCTVTDANSCTTTQTFNITQPASAPTISVTSGAICKGQSFVMIPSGASTYTFSNGSTTVSPTSNTSYSVTGTDGNGCVSSNTAVSTVTVNALPTVSVTSGAICKGQSFVMIPSGASTYTFSNGSATVSPTSNTSYSVTGTDGNGCVSSNTAVSTVTVNALPTVSVTSGVICNGQSFVMIPSGASTYTFSNGSATVSPTSNTSYSVTGTDGNGCVSSNTAVSTVTVNALPTVSVTSGAICVGSSFTISPSGALTYTYSSGSPVVTPTATASYTVVGTDINGCTNSAICSVTVNAVPSLSVNSGAICAGSSFTMSPIGALTYTYSSGSPIVSPTVTSSYTVIGSDVNGCKNSAVSSVTVNPIPLISVNSITICAGSTGTLFAHGAATYTWNTGVNTSSLSASPTVNTSYTVSGTSIEGCVGLPIIATISIGNAPSIFVNNPSVCAGSSATLIAGGVTSYTWSTGANTNSIVVTPSVNTTYTVGGNLTGCVATAIKIATVTVHALPTISASTSNTLLCLGQTATLTVSGSATSYTWGLGGNTMSIVVSPTVQTTYMVYGTDVNGCSNSASITQSVTVCTDIININSLDVISVYPNPFNELLTVEVLTTTHVMLFDALGKVVYNQTLEVGKHQINLSDFASGLYIIKATSNSKVNTIRLMKK